MANLPLNVQATLVDQIGGLDTGTIYGFSFILTAQSGTIPASNYDLSISFTDNSITHNIWDHNITITEMGTVQAFTLPGTYYSLSDGTNSVVSATGATVYKFTF